MTGDCLYDAFKWKDFFKGLFIGNYLLEFQ